MKRGEPLSLALVVLFTTAVGTVGAWILYDHLLDWARWVVEVITKAF